MNRATPWAPLPFDLGRVSPMNASETCDWILSGGHENGGVRILANLNLHGAYLTYTDESFRVFTQSADAVLIDGWPILKLAKVASRSGLLTSDRRLGSTDWLEELIRRDPPLKVVAIGGSADTSRGMAAYVDAHASSLCWVGYDGYRFEPQRAVRCAAAALPEDALNDADLVLVGLGMPVQERWILEHLSFLPSSAVIANVGGCFDYFAGNQKLAPRWMGNLGLEWLYRLIHSPKRLAGRYLWEPVKLAAVVASGRTRAERSGASTASDRV